MKFWMRSMLLAAATGFLGIAIAQDSENKDRKKREERRALKMSEVEQLSANDAKRKAYRKAARQKRLQAIKQAKDTISKGTLTVENKAALQYRLAEMYFEEGRYYYFDEMERFQKEFDECFNTDGCNTEKITADNSTSQKWQKRAIKLYDNVLKNYPNYQRADQVLYSLGAAYQEIKQPEKAVKNFRRLTKTYTDSRFLSMSYVQIGEYYFDKSNPHKALEAYLQATKDTNFASYGFAVYKLAWCYYNVGELDEAINSMKRVVRYSQNQQSANSENSQAITLKSEALKDLVRFFADSEDMQEAENYFSSLGEVELYNKMLKRLASMYFEQGKFELAITTFKKLIADAPDAVEAPTYQNEIINAYKRMNNKEQTLREIRKLKDTFRPDTPL